MENRLELVTYSTGTAAEALGMTRRTVLNYRDRHGIWPTHDDRKLFRADVFDLAEMLAMKKLFGQIGGEEAAWIAKLCTKPVAFFALLHFSVWENGGRALEATGIGQFEAISALIEKKFPGSKAGGLGIWPAGMPGEPKMPRRWLVFWESNFDDVLQMDDLDRVHAYMDSNPARKREVGKFLNLEEIGAELAERFPSLVRVLAPEGSTLGA